MCPLEVVEQSFSIEVFTPDDPSVDKKTIVDRIDSFFSFHFGIAAQDRVEAEVGKGPELSQVRNNFLFSRFVNESAQYALSKDIAPGLPGMVAFAKDDLTGELLGCFPFGFTGARYPLGDGLYSPRAADAMFVLPQYRRQGIGMRLFQELEWILRASGVTNYVTRAGDAGADLMRKAGFQLTKLPPIDPYTIGSPLYLVELI